MFSKFSVKFSSVFVIVVLTGHFLVTDCSPNNGKAERNSQTGRRKSKPPLVEVTPRPTKRPKQTHCHFGNQSYELEERWRPDLGPPFGILYCVRCECIAMQRKKRKVAKTRCENIKNVCPKPTCENPVLLAERCCKTCPGEDNADVEEDLAMRKLESDDDDKNTKEFAVLLTGRGLSPTVPALGAGRAYITTSKRHLYYSIILSGLERPSFVRFLDDDGSILEEHEVSNPLHHANSSKVCGVWRKVPKVYRRLLQKEKLTLSLASDKQPEGSVAGKILRNMRINKEVFSSLMVPGSPKSKETLGGGGIAIISTEWNSIYLVLDFNGIFLPTDSRDVPVYVQLIETELVPKPRTVTSSVAIVPKVHPEYNTASLKIDLNPEAQHLLNNGRLSLRLSAKDDAMFLIGRITTKVTCNVFQATMTQGSFVEPTTVSLLLPELEAGSVVDATASQSSSSLTWNDKNPAGSALVTLHIDGTVSYSIESVGLTDQSVMVTLESEDPTKKELRTLVSANETLLTENKVTGVFPQSVQEVEMLLNDDLFITMTFNKQQAPIKLSGRVRQRLYADAFVNEMPMLLEAENLGSPSAVGQAWLAVDKECGVHYAVYVAGLPIADASILAASNGKMQIDDKKRERHLVELIEIPPDRIGPTQQRVLQRLNGEEAEDVQEDVELSTLSRVKLGYVYLAVSFKIPGKGKTIELKAKIRNIPIPVTCLPRQDKFRGSSGSSYVEDESNDIYGANEAGRDGDEGSMVNKCHYEKESFDDGAQWKAQHDHCRMCSCQRGRVICDTMVCPSPPCENPVTVPGECCHVCPGENPIGSNTTVILPNPGKSIQRGCFFEGDKKFHPTGSKWHPYIPPFGFSRCAVCTCESDSLSVECKRITCPPLPCPEKEAFRENPTSCCKQCQSSMPTLKSEVILLPGQLGDQGSKKTVKDIMSLGGCKFQGQIYSNGDVWHPTVQPYGEMKCINCHCKDGRFRCKRQKCPKLTCEVKVNTEECCQRCLESSEIKNSGSIERRPGHRRKTRERKPKEE